METPKVNPAALAQASALFTKFNDLTTPPNIFQVGDRNASTAAGASPSSMFPAAIGSTDPEDQRYMLQSQMVSNGSVANIGTPIVGKEFFDYAKRKQDQALNFEFTQWVMGQADLSKPESAAWWFEKFPWMKDLRLGQIEREAEVQKRLAKISITGPQDSEDFMILFMKEQGLLKPANVPLYKLNDPANATIQTGGFVAGVFNPLNTTYPKSMAESLVPFSNPVNGAWGAPALPTPQMVGTTPPAQATGGIFNPQKLLGAGGALGP